MTPSPELSELLAALRDGTLAGAELARLDAILAESPEARAYYLEYVDLCTNLRHYQGATPQPAPATERSPVSGRRWLGIAVAVGLGAVAAAVLIGLFRLPPEVGPERSPETAVAPPTPRPPGVALLTRSVGASWVGVAHPPGVGAPLPAGRVHLSAGLVQLEFYGGAAVVLEGPVEFELRDAARGFCQSGRLTARAGPNARGFVIGTPRCEVTDRGTEFGLSVTPAGDEVRVFEGRVAVTAPAPFEAREVPAGQGLRVAPDGTTGPVAPNPAPFVTAREMERRATDDSRAKYGAWKEESARLRADERVAVYYSFEDQQPWDRTLRSDAPGARRELDGAVVGCRWVTGRWPGKGALEFKHVGDRVRVNVPEEFRSFTLAAWVRVDSYDRWLSALLLADGWERGALHWQLSDTGAVILGSSRQIRHDSPPVIGMGKLGQWTLIAAVCDQDARTVTHYVDGRRVSAGRTFSDAPVRIGPAEIGNWGAPSAGDTNPVRSFNGLFDEFIIFRAALTSGEIGRLYDAGKPNS